MPEDNHFVAHPEGGVTTEGAIAAQAAPATEPTAEPEVKPEGDEAPAAEPEEKIED